MHKLECDGQTDTQNSYINFALYANVQKWISIYRRTE